MDWYNVESKLPEPFMSVLVYMPDEKPLSTVHEGYITNDGTWVCSYTLPALNVKVSHWADMPEYPKLTNKR